MDGVQMDNPAPAPNGAHELQARLYRELGVAAVAAALACYDAPNASAPEAALRDQAQAA